MILQTALKQNLIPNRKESITIEATPQKKSFTEERKTPRCSELKAFFYNGPEIIQVKT